MVVFSLVKAYVDEDLVSQISKPTEFFNQIQDNYGIISIMEEGIWLLHGKWDQLSYVYQILAKFKIKPVEKNAELTNLSPTNSELNISPKNLKNLNMDSGMSDKTDSNPTKQFSTCAENVIENENLKSDNIQNCQTSKSDKTKPISNIKNSDISKKNTEKLPTYEKLNFICNKCNFKFNTKSRLEYHQKRVHAIKHLPCLYCSKFFSIQQDLNRHMKIHLETYKCTVCSKSYANSQLLNRHLKTHQPAYRQPRFSCTLCCDSFTSKQNLKKHANQIHHHMKKRQTCRICSLEFEKSKDLLNHRRVEHSKNFSFFQCNKCNRYFESKANLYCHKLIHTKGKTFTCNICSKTLKTSSSLSTHKKIHISGKHFSCDLCKKSFTQKQALFRHKLTHTQERPFQCELCGATFNDSSVLRRHKLHRHKSVNKSDSQQKIAEFENDIGLTGDVLTGSHKQHQVSVGYRKTVLSEEVQLADNNIKRNTMSVSKNPQNLNANEQRTDNDLSDPPTSTPSNPTHSHLSDPHTSTSYPHTSTPSNPTLSHLSDSKNRYNNSSDSISLLKNLLKPINILSKLNEND